MATVKLTEKELITEVPDETCILVVATVNGIPSVRRILPDEIPMIGSHSLVTSGGIYEVLAALEARVAALEQGSGGGGGGGGDSAVFGSATFGTAYFA